MLATLLASLLSWSLKYRMDDRSLSLAISLQINCLCSGWMMPSLMREFSFILTRHLPVTSCRRIQGYSGVEAFQEIRYHLFQEGLTVEVIVITAVPPEPLLHIHHGVTMLH